MKILLHADDKLVVELNGIELHLSIMGDGEILVQAYNGELPQFIEPLSKHEAVIKSNKG